MQTVTYTEMPNGARYLSTEGKQMDIINVLTQKEFKEKFPEVSTYGIEMHMPVFLENGEILLDTQWNGEEYLVKGKSYSPFYKETEEDTEIIGYYED